MRIVPSGPGRDAYLPLLLLADDAEAAVRGYYQSGDLYALDAPDGAPLALVLAVRDGDGDVELKAVAVDAGRHGQGLGSRLLALVLADLRRRGVRRCYLGTGTCGIGQLAFYQKAGFRLHSVERDWFTPERGYPEGITEHGIPLRDLVWLDCEL